MADGDHFDITDANGKEHRFVGASWQAMKPDQSIIEIRNKAGKTIAVFFNAAMVRYPETTA